LGSRFQRSEIFSNAILNLKTVFWACPFVAPSAPLWVGLSLGACGAIRSIPHARSDKGTPLNKPTFWKEFPLHAVNKNDKIIEIPVIK
jgi:hypothetical protein